MAFEGLSDKLQGVFKGLKGKGSLTEADINAAMREVKLALLEADVNFKVVKEFVAEVKEKAMGEEVMKSLTPAQQVIKIVNEQLVELMGGTPAQCADACAIAIANQLGLVCDPVAGLVEIPCIKRNVSGLVIALSSADLALAGIEAKIPADECLDAMRSVGDTMPDTLKETAKGGLAATPTGIRMRKQVFGENV